MLMASFVLLALGSERAQLEGAIKYVSLNLLASAFFLIGVGLLYGLSGTLNLAHLAERLHEPVSQPVLVSAVTMFFLAAFGIKAALFPFFFWLPASYHTPPVPVSAIFAGLLTKVGVYALIRLFTLVFTQETLYTHAILLGLAGFTMVTGVLGAAAQNEYRRILSFHIVSQIGYMVMGLGLAGVVMGQPRLAVFALAGSVFYIIHHIIVKTNLFLISGVARELGGSFELKSLGGLYRSHPALAVLFLVPALSLAGMPPLSGFFAKLALIRAGLEAEYYLIVAAALVVGLLTLFSMTKIWVEVFWKPTPPDDGGPALEPGADRRLTRAGLGLMTLPIAVLAVITVLIGLGAEPVFELSLRAAEQLIDPTEYLDVVRGGNP
jgi:multicomponent Na+:H+ antiporter subunit D